MRILRSGAPSRLRLSEEDFASRFADIARHNPDLDNLRKSRSDAPPPAPVDTVRTGSKKRRRPLWIAVLATLAVVAGGLAFQLNHHPGTLQRGSTTQVGKPAPAPKPVTDYQLKMGQLQGTWPASQSKPAAVTRPGTQFEPQTQARPQTDISRQTQTQTQVGQPPAPPAPPAPPQNTKPAPAPQQTTPQQPPQSQPSPDQASGSNSGGSVSSTDPQDPNQGQNGTCPPGESPDGSGGCW